MNRQTIPLGGVMGRELALSNAVSIDISETTRLVWVSGQVAFDDQGNIVGQGNMGIQTEKTFENMKSVLEKVGGTLDDVVNMNVFVKEMDTMNVIHDIRLKYFNKPYPTSTTVQITDFVLPDILIEIDAQAVITLK